MQTTGADGRYEFTVAVVNRKAENPEDRLYRYRVKIIQPDEQETMIWSDLRTGGKHLDSDIVPSNAFMDLRVSAVDKMFGGPVPEGTELEIPGIYDPGNLNMSLMSGLGDVNGMVNTRSYRIGISLRIYDLQGDCGTDSCECGETPCKSFRIIRLDAGSALHQR